MSRSRSGGSNINIYIYIYITATTFACLIRISCFVHVATNTYNFANQLRPSYSMLSAALTFQVCNLVVGRFCVAIPSERGITIC